MSESIKIAMKFLKATNSSGNSKENETAAIRPTTVKTEGEVPSLDLAASLAECMTRLDDKDFTPLS